MLLNRARDDDDVVAAAITGSAAAGTKDEWSDVDVAFACASSTSRSPIGSVMMTPCNHAPSSSSRGSATAPSSRRWRSDAVGTLPPSA